MPWSASWIESTRRCESSPEPKSQAERRLNSTLSIPFILPLTMRGGAVGYEPHASSCNSHDKGQQFNELSSRARKRYELFKNNPRIQNVFLKMNVLMTFASSQLI